MKITEVRIKLMDEPGERLRAFCSITFDNCFVVRDLKIIEGTSGPFVAMPSRKLTSHCGRCGMKNHLRANHCNQCGARLPENRLIKDADGRAKLYADIAHPINSSCREMIQEHVVNAYYNELELAKDPNYVSRYDDFDGGDYTPDPPQQTSGHEQGGSNRSAANDQREDNFGEAVQKPIRRYDAAHPPEELKRLHQRPASEPQTDAPSQGRNDGPPPADDRSAEASGESNHHTHRHGAQDLGGPHSSPHEGAKQERDRSSGAGDSFGAGIFD